MRTGRISPPVGITVHELDGVPIYRQIANQVRYLVASGLLRTGDELPPIRKLAASLRVAPHTVVQAYNELGVAGVVKMRRGAGTFIAAKPNRVAVQEARLALERRIDILLSEAHQLDVSADELVQWLWKRKAVLESKRGEPAGLQPAVVNRGTTVHETSSGLPPPAMVRIAE